MGRIRNSREPARPHAAPDDLSLLYMPQVEQFGVTLRQQGNALLGTVSDERADGTICVYRLGNFGVITSHRILVKRDVPFFEHGVASLCISTMSSDSLELCPILQPDHPKRAGNVAVFGQQSYERSMPLRAGSRQDAISITLRADWFDRLESQQRATAREMIDTASEACTDEVGQELDALLRQISPLFGGVLASERELYDQTRRAFGLMLSWHDERERAEAAAGTLEQARLARAARHLVVHNLDRPLSVNEIARDLYTSRTRLCTSFKQETGESLGAFITRMRMERAARLLASSVPSVSEVARAVGYPRTSSFTVAFERAFGCTPTAWRAQRKAQTPPAADRAPQQPDGPDVRAVTPAAAPGPRRG